MPNRIFETIFNRQIENFIQSFITDAKSIFYKDNSLIHPGEYGYYREESFKKLLRTIINSKYDIESGFIITSKDEVSTQCDIVIYDSKEMPLLKDDISQFFTVESVLAIGEIKSDMNITEFKLALRKLAENKKLRNINEGAKKNDFGHNRETEYLFSFLVCRKLSFDIKNLNLDDIYVDIPSEYRHNLILSVEDGISLYTLSFDDLPEPMKSRANASGIADYPYPVHQIKEIIHKLEYHHYPSEPQQNLKHIRVFLIALAQGIDRSKTFVSEILSYTGESAAKITWK